MSASYDWAHPRTAHAFTGFLQDGFSNPSGLVVRMVTHSPIPYTKVDWEESGQKRIVGTIVGFPKLGFANAPYSKKPDKPSKYAPPPPTTKPQPLLEPAATANGEVTAVRMYNFLKGDTTFDKGDRDDSSVSTLAVGQTFTSLISKYLYDKPDSPVFPKGMYGMIPAYTVIEVQLNPSHNSPKTPGYSVKIAKIKALDFTLYSLMACGGPLEKIQKTPEAAMEFGREQAKLCEPICNMVEQSRYGIYASVEPTARVVDLREDLEFVRIECPHNTGNTPLPGVHCLDVSHADMMRFTNSPGDIVAARTLVDLAIAAGSLRMFVTFDEYYNRQEPLLSQHRGVPLVDCASFLEPISEGELQTDDDAVTFNADWKVQHDTSLQAVGFRVTVAPTSQAEGSLAADGTSIFLPPPCADMPLVSPVCGFDRGYRVVVGNPGAEDGGEDEACYVLDAYFNAAPNRAGAAAGGTTGYKRVKL